VGSRKKESSLPWTRNEALIGRQPRGKKRIQRKEKEWLSFLIRGEGCSFEGSLTRRTEVGPINSVSLARSEREAYKVDPICLFHCKNYRGELDHLPDLTGVERMRLKLAVQEELSQTASEGVRVSHTRRRGGDHRT